MRDVPLNDRPREKLFNFGAEVLGDSELLGILISSGNREQDVMGISKGVLENYDFRKLSRLSISQLEKEFGIGRVKACQIVACFEMGRRAVSSSGMKDVVIRDSADVVRGFGARMMDLESEHFKVIYLNVRRKVLREKTLFIGTLDESVVHPREIFKVALEEGAAGVILLHNHPSGESDPSDADITITRNLIEAGKILGVEVLDHVIIGKNNYCSLAEDGLV